MFFGNIDVNHSPLVGWIEQAKNLCKPSAVHVCDGSEEEYRYFCQLLVDQGALIPLNPSLRPDSFLARSHPDDTARV